MRIFINNADSYVGRALCADLRKVLDQENRILGSLTQDSAEADGELLHSLGVKRVVARANKQKYLSDVLSCSLIVCDLHSADLNDVETLIKELKVAELDHDTTFVLISSVMAWANTRKQYVPLVSPEEEEEGGEDEVEEVEVKKRPKELTDADLERRVPAAAYEAWKYLETLTLSLSSKAKLRPHVIGAGVLYGNGETVFNELFKAAWLTQPVHKIIAPGDNYIPCVHVRDVARLVRVVVSDASVSSYLMAVDHSRLTQAAIIQGIISQMSHSRDVPVCPAEEVDSEFKEVMSLDLILEPSAPLKDPQFAWWCRDGIIANIEKVAAEFCKWRNLRPIKMVVVGPPGCGAERLCARVAKHYLHEEPPHLTYQQIIEDACAVPNKAGRKLRKKVQKLAADPSKKLPLQLRTKLVQSRLLSNVCRYRGYVLEGYPTTYAEAEALFMEQVKEGEEEEEEAVEEADADDGDEDVEDEEEEEVEEVPASKEDDEDEEEVERPKFKVAEGVVPEYGVLIQSSEPRCKARIFHGDAKGPSSEEDFNRETAEYRGANLAEDGTPSTAEFFLEQCGLAMLPIDVDNCSEEEAFQAIRIHMESKGQFFNYLRSEEDLMREEQEKQARLEEERDVQEARDKKELGQKETALREKLADEEESRRRVIARNEAAHLEAEARMLDFAVFSLHPVELLHMLCLGVLWVLCSMKKHCGLRGAWSPVCEYTA
ncbi:AK7 [Symbiodinium natans]|uniref:AK7 protein n=1 Tax=Symbiodinium natans TaxID=878477 RepID=A0A812RUU1_9DINO|nr:AK7 [Symbiodinium natans]